jgi:hypothetical protein
VGEDLNKLMARLARGAQADTPALKTGDGAEAAGGGDAADGASGELGVLDKMVDFGKDIPVIDFAAAAVGTGLATYSDVHSGQSLATALPEEAASNVAGVVAGSLVGGAAMTAVGGGLIGGAVAAGAAGVVAFGVGDFTDKLLHQNWGGDIHTYGVADGITYGIGDSALQTGDDVKSLGTDIGHTAEHLWDKIF